MVGVGGVGLVACSNVDAPCFDEGSGELNEKLGNGRRFVRKRIEVVLMELHDESFG